MTKKKRILTRLLVVLCALTLISCCFLGSTFARYTSSNSGSGSLNVAKWEVSVTEEKTEGETAVEFGKLSPSMAEYSAGTPRTNTTGKVKVATIENKSAVDAEIAVTAGDLSLTPVSNGTYDEGEAKSVFSVKLYYTTIDAPTKDEDYTEITDEAPTFTLSNAESTTGKIAYIYAEVVWTSQDTATESGDALDTMVGLNVTSVTVPITYTATQATQIPVAPASGS